MKRTYAPSTPFRKVRITVDLDAPMYDALVRYSGRQRTSYANIIKQSLRRDRNFIPLLNEETEAYAKDINHTEDHSPKIDIIRRIEDDKAIHNQ